MLAQENLSSLIKELQDLIALADNPCALCGRKSHARRIEWNERDSEPTRSSGMCAHSTRQPTPLERKLANELAITHLAHDQGWSQTCFAEASMQAIEGGKVFLTVERHRDDGYSHDSLTLGPLDPESARDALRRYDAMIASGGRPADS
jgi:hypothetical protein